MVTVKSVGILSVGIVSGIIGVAFGLLAGLWMAGIASMLSMIDDMYMSASDRAVMSWMFSGAAVFFMPVLYGITGFIGGIISAALYNLIAKWVGGVRVELVSPKSAAEPPVQ